MTAEEFRQLTNEQAERLSPLLRAMWQDAQANWSGAHELAQDVHTEEGSWVHAYLHRKEGDESNARYWYRRADKPVYTGSLESEWQTITAALLAVSPQTFTGENISR